MALLLMYVFALISTILNGLIISRVVVLHNEIDDSFILNVYVVVSNYLIHLVY